jgi:hypothetical protein
MGSAKITGPVSREQRHVPWERESLHGREQLRSHNCQRQVTDRDQRSFDGEMVVAGEWLAVLLGLVIACVDKNMNGSYDARLAGLAGSCWAGRSDILPRIEASPALCTLHTFKRGPIGGLCSSSLLEGRRNWTDIFSPTHLFIKFGSLGSRDG